jgi:drug/metabolite transporter (DMT)-like permease
MRRDNKALLFGLTAVLLWSTVATAFKLALAELDIFQLLFYGALVSALSLLLMVILQGKLHLLWRYARRRLMFFLAMGLLNPVIYYLVLFRAYDLLPAQQAQPINYTWAITMALLAVPLLGQRLSGRDIVAAFMCYLGVLVIATRGDLLQIGFDSVEGVAWALLSTVIWAVYWLANTRASHDPVVGLCLSFLMAAPVAGVVCFIYSDPLHVSGRGLAAAIYVGLIEMGITFALWASALRMASGVARIGNLIFLSPLLSLVFIATVLGEDIEPATLVGLALIIPALWMQQSQGGAQQTGTQVAVEANSAGPGAQH